MSVRALHRLVCVPSAVTAALVLCCTLSGQTGDGTTSGKESSGRSAPQRRPVPATLRVGKERHKVLLLGRKEDKLLYTYADSTHRAVATIDAADVRSVDIRVEYDRGDLEKYIRKQEWAQAGALLFRVVYPLLPFLDLKGNNMLPLALRAANYMMAAGAVKSHGGWTKQERETARREYLAARVILSGASRAVWSSLSVEARLKEAICLVMLEDIDEADRLLEATEVPYPADANYGLYRLARSRLLVARGEFQDGIEEAVQSLLFETKDLGTFPDALLLSAHCYEALEEWYRARDVYYEVARLFHQTHWGEFAESKLRAIMLAGHTKTDETAKVENVFFGIEEDLNAKANALLGIVPDGQADKKEKDAK